MFMRFLKWYFKQWKIVFESMLRTTPRTEEEKRKAIIVSID